MNAAAPTISDEWIAERWPGEDAAEVRRRFDALMDKLGETPWRGIPRFPEVMQPVLAWAAMLPQQRVEALTEALANVPDHLREQLWKAEKPMFGEQRVKFDNVVGDDGHGMGRQAVAITPYVKGYNLAPWIAAASPGNVGALLAERNRLREALTPSAETKAAYMGEFQFRFPIRDHTGEEVMFTPNVPWTTIKEIMAAISAYAVGSAVGESAPETPAAK